MIFSALRLLILLVASKYDSRCYYYIVKHYCQEMADHRETKKFAKTLMNILQDKRKKDDEREKRNIQVPKS